MEHHPVILCRDRQALDESGVLGTLATLLQDRQHGRQSLP